MLSSVDAKAAECEKGAESRLFDANRALFEVRGKLDDLKAKYSDATSKVSVSWVCSHVG